MGRHVSAVGVTVALLPEIRRPSGSDDRDSNLLQFLTSPDELCRTTTRLMHHRLIATQVRGNAIHEQKGILGRVYSQDARSGIGQFQHGIDHGVGCEFFFFVFA